jgi:hypothetical protein
LRIRSEEFKDISAVSTSQTGKGILSQSPLQAASEAFYPDMIFEQAVSPDRRRETRVRSEIRANFTSPHSSPLKGEW